ncbi:Hsp70 family protein [Comamonas resistens]|uniref:Hsp70 family protein n=1 Tax=Comamonas resistens TaxID=3046670 RepID=A0ABY8SV95_9BURK|nr:Hsp70 family protein [Comamonas resistens]MDL5036063.1 Hsp70 family protein [Comamonas resistens]WHS66161.1 Hsp70 family protein [Comamonas resistens]
MHPSRPILAVGIDLGTSHTVVASVPLDGAADDIALLDIPQRSTAGEVLSQPLLPSVRYQAAPGELGEAWQQPWPPQEASTDAPAVIGRWARDLGAAVPHRLVASAKSWLSHNGVDRTAPILPWGAGDDVAKISPLAASASYLAHVRAAWDRAHPAAPLHQQTVVLTVPASFDEGARALTLEAAQLAGLSGVQLLEEPKAAFHDWLLLQGDALAKQLEDSRLVLVVDVGGGTTDLTLIRVEAAPGGGLPALTRTAVGDHLMLGGDNMDLALAHQLEGAFAGEGQKLPTARFAQLVQRCRIAKEQLLAQNAPDQLSITLLGGGSKLLARTQSAILTRAQVQQSVVEGFLPQVQLSDTPGKRQGALRGFGLPYPADAAISRHLAQFLARHAGGELPDTVLLNGGVFHAHAIVQRLTDLLTQWRGSAVRVLHNPHPDWAVARGAAAYGLAQYQHQQQAAQAQQESQSNPSQTQSQIAQAAIKSEVSRIVPRIGGGSARSYWLLLPGKKEEAPQGICLLPHGTEEGVRIVLSGRRFALKLGQAVRFNLLASSQSQAQGQAGQIAALSGEGWVELPPLSAVLPAPEGRAQPQVEVQLQACMTEVGTLEVRCVAVQDASQSWLLPFAVRGAVAAEAMAGSTDVPGAESPNQLKVSVPRLTEAVAQIDRIFGTQAQEVTAKEVRQLRQSLEKLLGPRETWDAGLLRALFDALLTRAKRRRRTADHERVWLNLAGWCLRPGAGAELDGWRIAQVWALYAQGLGYPKEASNWTEWWVFWRRVAAGLNEAQQMELLEDVAGHMQKAVQKNSKSSHGSYDDMLRLFAAMEAVPWQYRQEMGRWMLQRLKREGETVQTWWAIGRLAARQSLAANAHLVMPPEAAQEFLNATLDQDWRKNETAMFAAVQMACMTGDRARDLPDEARAQVLEKMRSSGAPERWIAMVEQVVQMQAEDQKRSLGDSLPPGLVLL